MEVPPQISYRNVEGNEELEALIEKRIHKLERIFDHIISCRVAVEQPQLNHRTGNPYRVRIDLRVPGHEIVIDRHPREGDQLEELPTALRHAFEAAGRRLREIVERMRGDVKSHPDHELMGLVVRLFRDESYGFLKTPDGREIYFHENSVVNGGFARLEVGTGVRFVEEAGEKGPQASTVQIVDKPGVRVPEAAPSVSEAPLGWGR